MASLLFDFDSTLVPVESLEVLCRDACGLSGDDLAAFEAITRAGMEGTLDFESSLRQRLALARPTRAPTLAIAETLAAALTPGAPELVAGAQAAGHTVWIVSGGFQEILLATGARLGLAPDAVHGVQCEWDADGSLRDLDPRNGFLVSKVEGLKRLGRLPPGPRIGIGDGATDLALRDAGFVDTFIAYTEHARRAAVVAAADFEATNMRHLSEILGRLWA